MPGPDPTRPDPSDAGLEPLSDAARARLSRAPTEPLRPPEASDHRAVARWRSDVHAAWLAGDPPPADRGHRIDAVAGVPALRAGAGDGPLVVYCHGGGYVLGSAAVAVPITERLAPAAEVVSVDYRLAPEHPCPAAVDDVVAVTAAVAADLDPDRPLVLAGDSAGANLALTAALAQGARSRVEAGARPVDGLVLLSPHLDHGDVVAERSAHRRDDVDDRARRWIRAAYCGRREPTDPVCSPLRASLTGLPPTLVQVGTVDATLGHGARLARRARAAGMEVVLDVWDGLWHTWHYHRDLPEADRALAEVGRFISGLAVIGPRRWR